MAKETEIFCSVCGLMYATPPTAQLDVWPGGLMTKIGSYFCSVECARTGALVYSQEKLAEEFKTITKKLVSLADSPQIGAEYGPEEKESLVMNWRARAQCQ